MNTDYIKVLIVDDHQLSALGVKAALSYDKKVNVIGIAGGGLEALKTLNKIKADVVLLDILMPVMDGLQTLQEIRVKFPKTKVILLSMSEDKDIITKAFALKAEGYIFKDVIKEDLLKAVNRVYRGEYHYSSRVFDIMLSDIIDAANPKESRGPDPFITNSDVIPKVNEKYEEVKARLTVREFEIFRMVGSGYSTSEIAKELNLSVYTVSSYRKNIYTKLNLHSLKALMKFASELMD